MKKYQSSTNIVSRVSRCKGNTLNMWQTTSNIAGHSLHISDNYFNTHIYQTYKIRDDMTVIELTKNVMPTEWVKNLIEKINILRPSQPIDMLKITSDNPKMQLHLGKEGTRTFNYEITNLGLQFLDATKSISLITNTNKIKKKYRNILKEIDPGLLVERGETIKPTFMHSTVLELTFKQLNKWKNQK